MANHIHSHYFVYFWIVLWRTLPNSRWLFVILSNAKLVTAYQPKINCLIHYCVCAFVGLLEIPMFVLKIKVYLHVIKTSSVWFNVSGTEYLNKENRYKWFWWTHGYSFVRVQMFRIVNLYKVPKTDVLLVSVCFENIILISLGFLNNVIIKEV